MVRVPAGAHHPRGRARPGPLGALGRRGSHLACG
jgi:hypothetical protein